MLSVSTGRKHKKRYWITCLDCHNRAHVAHPNARYCSEACADHAYRQRLRKRREQEAAEAQRKRIEWAKAEAARKVKEARQAEAARRSAEKKRQADALAEAQQRRYEALKARQVLRACECGSALFHIRLEWTKDHHEVRTLYCSECGKAKVLHIASKPKCPYCNHDELFVVNLIGRLWCGTCKREIAGGFTP